MFAESIGEGLRRLFAGDAYLLGIILLSLRVSGTAVLLGSLIGIPVGAAIALARFPLRRLAITLIYTGFALPPVVVGLFVYLALSRDGIAGDLNLLFTPTAMIVSQTLLALPYIAGITLAAVQAVPSDVREQARALGATPLHALWTHLREARLGVTAAVVAGFGAAISEVGAVMMVGGNIAGETRVLTTAILLETRRGQFGAALALGLILLLIAFMVNALLTRVQQGGTTRRSPGS
jgi:tungstate transport system permease protein